MQAGKPVPLTEVNQDRRCDLNCDMQALAANHGFGQAGLAGNLYASVSRQDGAYKGWVQILQHGTVAQLVLGCGDLMPPWELHKRKSNTACACTFKWVMCKGSSMDVWAAAPHSPLYMYHMHI